jgi:RNA polymerase primary sigma factor
VSACRNTHASLDARNSREDNMGATLLHDRRTSSDDDALSAYLREIRAYPLLDRDEELALAKRVREGDAEARERLVCANLRFVVSVAKKYQGRGVALSDLINEGNLGLLRAAERFDESKGVKFISYAVWWVRQAVIQTLAESSHSVRVPLGRAGMVQRISRRASGLRQELGREPTHQEIAAGLDYSEAEIDRSMTISRASLSLDAPLADGESSNLLDFLTDDSNAAPEDEVTGQDLAESVRAALGSLREREANVLRLYFGIDRDESLTLEEIGEQMGITRERVRQIKEKALRRIRASRQAATLASFHAH